MTHTPNSFPVTKASGDTEAYNPDKLLNSLIRSRVPQKLRNQALKYLEDKLHPGITTQELHDHLDFFLRRQDSPAAARYNLKRAIFELGPTGYPFEKYFAQILKKLGYRTQLNREIPGQCITHEIDILALKQNSYSMIECKHHSRPGTKSDAKVALYTLARFQDLQAAWEKDRRRAHPLHQVWLVTNTKLTLEAYKYCRCRNMKVVSWNHPPGANLPQLVESTSLYPITCLPSLSPTAKQHLINQNLVLCQDLPQVKSLPRSIIPKSLLQEAQRQARLLCLPQTKS